MNKDGHRKSLVPAHPGNTNAVKAGVFSPRILATRVAEVDAELASQSHEETFEAVLRQEIAALTILAQAMDASLEQEGIRGRGGEPRSLIDRRLRVNDRLRRTLELYMQDEHVEGDSPSADASESQEISETFLQALAASHFRESVKLIRPRDFDPETFLQTVVETLDPVVRFEDKRRARQLLTKRRRRRPEHCVCWTTLMAGDEAELRNWINKARAGGVQCHEQDAWLASVVRRLASQGRLDDEPFSNYRRTWWAVQKAVEVGVARINGRDRGEGLATRRTQERDGAVRPFWTALLSPSARVTPRRRLEAFASLDELGALPECTCDPDEGKLREEERHDASRAYVIRSVAQRHHRAATVIAEFPETFHAVRDAIDAKVAADERAQSVEKAESVESDS